jgi:hypothetical protein
MKEMSMSFQDELKKLREETYARIADDLKDDKLTCQQIAAKHDVHINTVYVAGRLHNCLRKLNRPLGSN